MSQAIIWACGGKDCTAASARSPASRDEVLEALAARCREEGVGLQVTGCLDQCDHGPMAVARPPSGTTRWFGLLADPEAATLLAQATAEDALAPEDLPRALARRHLPHRDGRRPRPKRR